MERIDENYTLSTHFPYTLISSIYKSEHLKENTLSTHFIKWVNLTPLFVCTHFFSSSPPPPPGSLMHSALIRKIITESKRLQAVVQQFSMFNLANSIHAYFGLHKELKNAT